MRNWNLAITMLCKKEWSRGSASQKERILTRVMITGLLVLVHCAYRIFRNCIRHSMDRWYIQRGGIRRLILPISALQLLVVVLRELPQSEALGAFFLLILCRAIQVIPQLRKLAAHLYSFQRTPAWVSPRGKNLVAYVSFREYSPCTAHRAVYVPQIS